MTTSLSEIAAEQQSESPVYFDNPAADQAVRLLLESLEEICVLRDRLDTVNRLVEAGEKPTPERIDGYEVSNALARERLKQHRETFETTFKRLGGN